MWASGGRKRQRFLYCLFMALVGLFCLGPMADATNQMRLIGWAWLAGAAVLLVVSLTRKG